MPKSIQTEQTTKGNFLDEKDIAILRELQQNAKASVKEIAEKVHLSTTPVHERIKRMEQSGVIKQYATSVSYTHLDVYKRQI